MAAIYTATQVKFKTIRWGCGITAGLLLILLLGVLFTAFSLRYIDSSYNAITHKAVNRTQAKAILRNFRETKVPANNIPGGWCTDTHGDLHGWITKKPSSSIYRYDFFTVPFSIHIIYDEQERIIVVVPTYE
jgi:hypothetical protein